MSGVPAPHDPDAERANRRAPAPPPRWVLRCWPASWRRSYGEEMADTWAARRTPTRDHGLGVLLGVAAVVAPPLCAAIVDRFTR